MRKLSILAAAAATAIILFSPPALASDAYSCQSRADRAELDEAALARALASAGLTRIGAWEREEACLETRARAADGRTIEVVLDPATGTILHRDDVRGDGKRRETEAQQGQGHEKQRERTDRPS